jgi:small subunit ribosomal protein S3
MGRKVNPIGFRLKVNKTWEGRWFAEGQEYVDQLSQDIELREMIREETERAGVSRIEIERFPGKVKITVHTAKPGILIGRKGENVKKLRANLEELVGKKIDLDIKEIKDPDLNAKLVLDRLIDQLQKRYPHRRAVSQAMHRVMGAGAKGVKVVFSGRIAGAEIGRTEKYEEGTVPTQTLRADIDYAEKPALTKSGYVGIKVYIYRGENKSTK